MADHTGNVDMTITTLESGQTHAQVIHTPADAAAFTSDSLILPGMNALAWLSQPRNARRDAEKHLSVIKADGTWFELPPSENRSALHWWKLLPEREAGHFGVFGYDNDARAFIMNVFLSENGLQTGDLRYLPFQFNPNDFYWHWLSIAPDWEYVGYVQGGAEGFDYFIYDTVDERFIWQTPYDGAGIVNVIWSQDAEWIALVSGVTQETASQIMSIHHDGTVTLLADLAAIFGDQAFIVNAAPQSSSTGLAAFWVDSPSDGIDASKLILLDLMTGNLIDLCLTTVEMPLTWDSSGAYLLFQVHDHPGRLTILSTQTGDYRYLDIEGDLIGVGVDASAPTPTPDG
ncbi:MAG: hypothetical protein K8I60_03175 [Anaerolineae bacterium]|nr:hypothetical protein [Anaerolineae bacterium]